MFPNQLTFYFNYRISGDTSDNLQHVETICADNALVMWQFAKATLAEKPAHLVSQIAADEQSAKQALIDAGFVVVT